MPGPFTGARRKQEAPPSEPPKAAPGLSIQREYRLSASAFQGYCALPFSIDARQVKDAQPPARVLLLTGTCGSGKTTVAALLAKRHGWVHVSEDEIWQRL